MDRKTQRRSVDLSGFPDLVVVYLGFRVTRLRGVLSLFRIGRGLGPLLKAAPDGLLAHEYMLFGPMHLGFRQYWRDLASLERFTHSEPHRTWWTTFQRDTGGSGFWHEAYSARGGMEAIYLDMPAPIGFAKFAPARTPEGPFMTARGRMSAVP
jgi:hypothetical protein